MIDLDELATGLGMDRLVEERVFGGELETAGNLTISRRPYGSPALVLPPYSTHLVSAWKVIHSLAERPWAPDWTPWRVHISQSSKGMWRAGFTETVGIDARRHTGAWGETPMEAICRAALRVVELLEAEPPDEPLREEEKTGKDD